METGRALLIRIAIACALALPSGSAWAQGAAPSSAPAPPSSSDAGRAAEFKKKGDDLMISLQYRDALEAYAEAYRINADPALLYNQGRAHQALTEYPAALDNLEEFARVAPPDLKARVPKLDELLADVRARVSVVEVRTNIPGAQVFVREKREANPARVRAGHARVEVRADGYVPWTREVDLRGGATTALDVTLEKVLASGTGMVSIATLPAGALVTIDGRPLGSAPLEASLRTGRHDVTVRQEGYELWTNAIELGSGERRRLDVTLERPEPVTKKWWFWTSVGAAVVGGTILTYALVTTRDPPTGSIDPGQVRGP
jgi:hypothetical protein